MREAQMFGENIILTRKIWVKAGENIIHLEDSIENLGFTAQPYMLLYHINYGFPSGFPGHQIIYFEYPKYHPEIMKQPLMMELLIIPFSILLFLGIKRNAISIHSAPITKEIPL